MGARALPIGFQKAPATEWRWSRQLVKMHNLSLRFAAMPAPLRQMQDAAGAASKILVLAVAAYSALLLAALIAFGAERGPAYAAHTKWRRGAKRPSCQDLITLLRKEMAEHPHLLAPLGLHRSFQTFTAAAAA